MATDLHTSIPCASKGNCAKFCTFFTNGTISAESEKISHLNKRIDGIEKSQGFLGEKYENLRKPTDGLIKENETIKKENLTKSDFKTLGDNLFDI